MTWEKRDEESGRWLCQMSRVHTEDSIPSILLTQSPHTGHWNSANWPEEFKVCCQCPGNFKESHHLGLFPLETIISEWETATRWCHIVTKTGKDLPQPFVFFNNRLHMPSTQKRWTWLRVLSVILVVCDARMFICTMVASSKQATFIESQLILFENTPKPTF